MLITHDIIYAKMRKTEDIFRLIDEAIKRKGKGWSRARMARELGKSNAWISKIMSGERNLSVSALLEIAEVLGVEPSSLITDKKEPMRMSFQEYCRGVIREILEEEFIKKIK